MTYRPHRMPEGYKLPAINSIAVYSFPPEAVGPAKNGQQTYALDITIRGEKVRCILQELEVKELERLRKQDVGEEMLPELKAKLFSHWGNIKNRMRSDVRGV
jgi:hypothetical protein